MMFDDQQKDSSIPWHSWVFPGSVHTAQPPFFHPKLP